jgi:hypothetical protein
MILVAAAFFRSRPADMGLRAYGVTDDEPKEIAWSEKLQGIRMKVFNQHIRKTKEFWNLPLIHHLGCTGHAIILIYSVPIAVDKGPQPHRRGGHPHLDICIQHHQPVPGADVRRAVRRQTGHDRCVGAAM